MTHWLKQIVTIVFVCFVVTVTLVLIFGMLDLVSLTFEHYIAWR